MKLKLISAISAAALALVVGATAFATPNQDKKEYVCHFTGSETNPFVVINVGNAAVPAHLANHQPTVHQGQDLSSNEPPVDCTGEPPPGE